MKIIILCVLILFTNIGITADSCDRVVRAPGTDQSNMAISPALDYFLLNPSQVLSMKVSDYSSWKGEQKGCLANVFHYGKLTVIYKETTDIRCQIDYVLHVKDNFVDVLESERNLKVRDIKKQCTQEKGEELLQTQKCLAKPKCLDHKVRDYFNNCECKYLTDLVSYEDQGDKYEGFYDPKRFFPKPDDIKSVF